MDCELRHPVSWETSDEQLMISRSVVMVGIKAMRDTMDAADMNWKRNLIARR